MKTVMGLAILVLFISATVFAAPANDSSDDLPVPADDSPALSSHLRESLILSLMSGVTEPASERIGFPGGAAGLEVFYRDAVHYCGKRRCLGAQFFAQSLFGSSPYLRFRLGLDTPSLILYNSKDGLRTYYRTPLVTEVMLNVLNDGSIGPDNQRWGNSYGLLSSRVGYRLETNRGNNLLVFRVESGPEVGYVKTRALFGPMAGGMAKLMGIWENNPFFLNAYFLGRFNVLSEFAFDTKFRYGLAAGLEIGFNVVSPYEKAISLRVGLRGQVDYFTITTNQNLPPTYNPMPLGLSFEGLLFIRAQIGTGSRY